MKKLNSASSIAVFSLVSMVTGLLIVLSAHAVIAEVGSSGCQSLTDTYDYNESPLYSQINGQQVQIGIGFTYDSPYANIPGATVNANWTAYNTDPSTGEPFVTATGNESPESAYGGPGGWSIDNQNQPGTWQYIIANTTFSAPGKPTVYGRVKGYNLANTPSCMS